MTARTGLTLPEEAKEWFRWQDGPAAADGPVQVGPSLTPGWYSMSLDGAVGSYLEGRRLSRQLAGGDGEGHWRSGAFTITPDDPTQLMFTQYPVPDEIAHPGFW